MNVLLLDAGFQPLSVITHRKLITLLSKQRVTFLTREQEEAVLAQLRARHFYLNEPLVVKLIRTVRIPRRFVRPTKTTLLLRDDGKCQYCGIIVSRENATIDHVLPISRGGSKAEWTNMVIACKRCNHRKDNKIPSEAGMTLRRKPIELQESMPLFCC